MITWFVWDTKQRAYVSDANAVTSTVPDWIGYVDIPGQLKKSVAYVGSAHGGNDVVAIVDKEIYGPFKTVDEAKLAAEMVYFSGGMG